jgi:hypothetical protein
VSFHDADHGDGRADCLVVQDYREIDDGPYDAVVAIEMSRRPAAVVQFTLRRP